TKADNEILHPASGQKAQQRQRTGEELEFAYRTGEVSFTCRSDHGIRIFSAEIMGHLRIDVAQHGIATEGPHARAVNLFHICLEAGLYHGLSSVAMAITHALAPAIVKRVIQVEDGAADQGARCARPPAFRPGLRPRSRWNHCQLE